MLFDPIGHRQVDLLGLVSLRAIFVDYMGGLSTYRLGVNGATTLG
jgi:hypothetical protein